MARIAHGVAFPVVLFLLLISHESSHLSPHVAHLLGEELYRVLHVASHDPTVFGISTLMLLELIVPILFSLVGLAALFCAAEMLYRYIRATYTERRPLRPRRYGYVTAPIAVGKLYRMHCVMRC